MSNPAFEFDHIHIRKGSGGRLLCYVAAPDGGNMAKTSVTPVRK